MNLLTSGTGCSHGIGGKNLFFVMFCQVHLGKWCNKSSLGLNRGRGHFLNFLGPPMILYHKQCISRS
jgi:hypothetical protein